MTLNWNKTKHHEKYITKDGHKIRFDYIHGRNFFCLLKFKHVNLFFNYLRLKPFIIYSSKAFLLLQLFLYSHI